MFQGNYLGLGGGGGEGPGGAQLHQQRLHVGGQVPAVPHQLAARHHHIPLCNVRQIISFMWEKVPYRFCNSIPVLRIRDILVRILIRTSY
jgi:hypothetical protein